MTTRPLVLAYLTSVYARVSHTFIRGEVAALRALGHTVHTFSVRRPAAGELISAEIRREYAATVHIVAAGPVRLVWAGLREAAGSPRRFLAAARLAQRFGTPGWKGRLWPQAYLLEAAFLARRLRAAKVEHLHNHFGEGSTAVAALAAALAGISFSTTIHGPSEFDRPTLLALREKVKRSAFTVAISHFGRSQLYRWCDHRDWSKIEVVRCGLHGNFLDGKAVPVPDRRTLVSVGRLDEQKGQMLLVEAAGRLRAQGMDFELILIGDGPLRKPLEDLIRRLGIQQHVRLAGWRSAEEVREAILASRALVLSSFAEGLPVVLMEALALRRPVISTAIAGIPELVKQGTCGWLVPAGSVDDLVDAMRTALTTPAPELDRMGREGARRVAERHNARIEAGKLAALFAQAVAGPTSAAPPAGEEPRADSADACHAGDGEEHAVRDALCAARGENMITPN